MRRHNSYSLQRINPNIKTQIQQKSRVLASPKTRLIFPASDDSAYIGGVGRKHYQKNTEFIHKLILNPSYNMQQQPISRSKSEGYLRVQSQQTQNQQNKKQPRSNLYSKLDSLSILQEQFSKKLTTEASPQKYKIPNQLITPNTDAPHKKSLLMNSKNSQFNIFASVDKLYEQIVNPTRRNNQVYNGRKFNPTYLSSDLGYV